MKRKHKNLLHCSILLTIVINFAGCHSDEKSLAPSAQHIATAKQQTIIKNLYFQGTLTPLQITPLISPANGTIAEVNFHYGDILKKGQKIVTLIAKQLTDNYRQAISDFLQKKSLLQTQKAIYASDSALFNAGAISREQYNDSKNSYSSAQLNFYQTKLHLESILKEVDMPLQSVESLSLNQIKKVSRVLKRNFNRIEITATSDGIALMPDPIKSADNTNQGKILQAGTSVNAGEVLVSIGDLHGYQIKFQVSELNIAKIKVGLTALITGDAFPGLTLRGYIQQVSTQATNNPADSDGPSMYNVTAIIPSVSNDTQKNLRIGMNAKVNLQLKNSPEIIIPFSAVFMHHDQPMVTVIDPKTKHTQNVTVITGETTLNHIVIKRGLNIGDKVLIVKENSSSLN